MNTLLYFNVQLICIYMYNFLNMMSKIKNVVVFMDSLCYILMFKRWAAGGQPCGEAMGVPTAWSQGWPPAAKIYCYKISWTVSARF